MSRRLLVRLILALMLLVFAAAPAAAAGPQLNFRAPLTGDEEVPAVDSQTVGVATFKLSNDETELAYKLIVANGEQVTQAHIHCGLPGTAGFVGEWMVILGTVKVNFWIAAAAATTLIWGAGYTLWMVKRVYFGEIANEHVRELADLDRREFAMLAALAIAVLAMGLYPKPFTDVMHTSVVELLRHAAIPKLAH